MQCNLATILIYAKNFEIQAGGNRDVPRSLDNQVTGMKESSQQPCNLEV